MNYLLLLHLNLSGMFSWETSISVVSTYNMPLSDISRATAYAQVIPVLSSRIILVPAPHQEHTQVSEGFGFEGSQLQPPSLQPSCSSLAVQPKTKVTKPPQLEPGSAIVPAQAGLGAAPATVVGLRFVTDWSGFACGF